jgi:hypothetical protein
MRFFRIVLIVLLAGVFFSCQNDGNKQLSGDLVTNPKSAEFSSDKKPVITFDKNEFDFGKILQGEVVSYTFHFKNTGNAPLLITNVDKSCGCTASDYPREPIQPGESGEIKITYDSKGHHGFQSKVLIVNSNTMPSQTAIRIKAEVRTPEQL